MAKTLPMTYEIFIKKQADGIPRRDDCFRIHSPSQEIEEMV